MDEGPDVAMTAQRSVRKVLLPPFASIAWWTTCGAAYYYRSRSTGRGLPLDGVIEGLLQSDGEEKSAIVSFSCHFHSQSRTCSPYLLNGQLMCLACMEPPTLDRKAITSNKGVSIFE